MTGRDLNADLTDPSKYGLIARGLRGTWPTIDKAMSAYPTLLNNYSEAGTRVADNAPRLDTSLGGAGDNFRAAIGGTPRAVGGGLATNIQPAQTPFGAAEADTRAPGSQLMQNGQSALPPETPINSEGQPYSPSLVNMPADQAANVAASMAAIRQAQAAGQNPYPGAGGVNTNAPVGFASIPTPPQPIRLAQNGPAPAFGSLGGPQFPGPQMPAPQACHRARPPGLRRCRRWYREGLPR